MIANILTFLIFAFFSLGELGRISLFEGKINFLLYEPLMALAVIYYFCHFKTNPIKDIFFRYNFTAYFFGWAILSLLYGFWQYSPQQNLIGVLYLARLGLYIFYFVYLSAFLKKNQKNGIFRKLFVFLIATAFVFSAGQYFLYPDLRNLYYQGWDPHLNRLFSVYLDTSTAAGAMGIFVIYFFISQNYPLFALFIVPFVLTFSRSAYLTLFSIFAYELYRKKNWQLILAGLMMFAIVFAAVPKKFGQGVSLTRIFSIKARLEDYLQGVRIWTASPLIGYGYNRIGAVKSNMGLLKTQLGVPLHSAASFSSSYLIVLVGTGIVGLILFNAAILQFVVRHKRLGALIYFLIILSLFDNILLHPLIMFLAGATIIRLSYR